MNWRHTLFLHRGLWFDLEIYPDTSREPTVWACDVTAMRDAGFVEIPDGQWFASKPVGIDAEQVDSGQWVHRTHTRWAKSATAFGSFADAVFYPVIKWKGLQFISEGWPDDCKGGTVLKLFATAEALESKRSIDRKMGRGCHPTSIDPSERARWWKEWSDYLDLLVVAGFRPHAEKYESVPLAASGVLPIADLDLVEGPPPSWLHRS